MNMVTVLYCTVLAHCFIKENNVMKLTENDIFIIIKLLLLIKKNTINNLRGFR